MSDVSHIILIPQTDYWQWVRAVRDYAIRFGAQVTPKAANARDFDRPNQTITIVNLPGGYPQQGDDIVAWFSLQDDAITLDVLDITNPKDLHFLLRQRLDAGQRFGPEQPPQPPPVEAEFKLYWPTEYPVITQAFGANPELYRRWNMPGHEGVDIRAPMNAKVFACADGEVYRVDHGSQSHGYGIHIRIRHAEGFRTIYAHLNQIFVSTGQPVYAGQVIGLADSTGNSTGSHLHITLKKEGATARGETHFPYDIVDPTPYFVDPDDQPATGQGFPPSLWPPQKALVGLHGRADGRMQEPDWAPFQTARVEALKLLSSAAPEDVDRARTLNPDVFIMVRLFADFRNRVVPASEFARWVEHDMSRMYNRGVRYFEVHNEPNLPMEGFGVSWQNGREFGQWMLDVIGHLKPKFPEAKFGWPGLSPGPTVAGIRFSEKEFLRSAGALVRQADWLACHCYWPNEELLFHPDGGLGYEFYRTEYADKLLFITEFSNPVAHVSMAVKGAQYRRYYEHIRTVPGVGAAFSFVVSASATFPHEVWRQEDGTPTAIPAHVAERGF